MDGEGAHNREQYSAPQGDGEDFWSARNYGNLVFWGGKYLAYPEATGESLVAAGRRYGRFFLRVGTDKKICGIDEFTQG